MRLVDDVWISSVDNSAFLWAADGCPQEDTHAMVVINVLGAVVHMLSSVSSQPAGEVYVTNIHRVIPRLWTGCVTWGHSAGHGRITGPCGCAQRCAPCCVAGCR